MANRINVPMWDKMQVFCKHIADHQIRLILHFNSPLNEQKLKEAVKITVENNPIASASYCVGKNEVQWRFSEINLEEIYFYRKCKNPEQLLAETILKQANTNAGPQLTISLIRSDTDILILNCNHAIADAAGVKNFIYKLAQNYSSILQNKTVHKLSYTPSRSLKALSKTLGVKEKFSILKAMLSNKKSAPTFKRDVELNKLQTPGFKTHTINSTEFSEIKEYGKKYSATVNDILLTVYYFTLKKKLKNSNKTNRLTYSSDLRRFLHSTDYNVLSNFSAIHNIDIDNTINDFVSLLKEISVITGKRKQKKYSLADFPMMAILFKTIPYKKLKGVIHKEFNKIKEGKLNAAPSLSNVGVLEEQKLDFNTLIPNKAYMHGGINHPGLLQLVVSTYKSNLTISVGTYYNEKNSTFIANFMKEFRNTINAEILN